MNFVNSIDFSDGLTTSLLALGAKLSDIDTKRLANYRRNWNFYEGYHWEEIPDTGRNEVTKNYCRAFVNKFVAFELGKGFNIKMKPDIEPKVLPFLNEVWDNNNKNTLCQLIGQSKSVTGDAWVQVTYIPKFLEDGTPNEDFLDPYNEYDKGKIVISVVPPNLVFPKYDDFNKDLLKEVKVMYPISSDNGIKAQLYCQTWTRENMVEQYGDNKVTYVNKYGIIPFFQCKNFPQVGRSFGVSDLDDVIPLNMELNLKSSDISEIIEYHSAPTTVVFGAKLGQLEKGANKMWGGLPTDARVENLELRGDLTASKEYLDSTKRAMHEVGNMPEGALGAQQAISNTSGVALQITMLPLIDRTVVKRALTGKFITEINKFIIKIGLTEGLIEVDLDKWRSGDTYAKDVYYNEAIFEDNLPKDKLVELQQIQMEMKLGTCDRPEAMKRLGKDNIEQRIKDITEDRLHFPELYNLEIDKNTGELLTGRVDPSILKNNNGLGDKSEGLDVMKRDIGVNKEGTDSEVNAGYQNSPVKRDKSQTVKGKEKSQ